MNVEKVTEGQIVDYTSGARLFFCDGEKKKDVLWHKNDNSHKSEDEHWVNACIYAVRTAQKITFMNEMEKECLKVSKKRFC